jgi:hypothetical protein
MFCELLWGNHSLQHIYFVLFGLETDDRLVSIYVLLLHQLPHSHLFQVDLIEELSHLILTHPSFLLQPAHFLLNFVKISITIVLVSQHLDLPSNMC